MFLLGDAARDEDAEMADAFVHGIDDGLAAGLDVVVAAIEVDDPPQRLLRRGDVVALGTEADDRRADPAQVDPLALAGDDLAGGQPVADEQLVDDPLDFLAVEVDVAAPPFLELDEALPLGIHLRPQVVVLGPQRVGGIQVLEILDQVPAVELAVAQVAGQRRHPAAAGQAAGVAHGVLAFHPGPVRQGRTGDDDGAEQLGPDRGHQHHGPAPLAVADDAGLALCLRDAAR